MTRICLQYLLGYGSRFIVRKESLGNVVIEQHVFLKANIVWL